MRYWWVPWLILGLAMLEIGPAMRRNRGAIFKWLLRLLVCLAGIFVFVRFYKGRGISSAYAFDNDGQRQNRGSR